MQRKIRCLAQRGICAARSSPMLRQAGQMFITRSIGLAVPAASGLLPQKLIQTL